MAISVNGLFAEADKATGHRFGMIVMLQGTCINCKQVVTYEQVRDVREGKLTTCDAPPDLVFERLFGEIQSLRDKLTKETEILRDRVTTLEAWRKS